MSLPSWKLLSEELSPAALAIADDAWAAVHLLAHGHQLPASLQTLTILITKDKGVGSQMVHTFETPVWFLRCPGLRTLELRSVAGRSVDVHASVLHGFAGPEEVPRAQGLLQRFLHAYQKVCTWSIHQSLMLTTPFSSTTTTSSPITTTLLIYLNRSMITGPSTRSGPTFLNA